MNTLTHVIGAFMAVGILFCGLKTAAAHHKPMAVGSCWIYGLSMILLYTMSSVYHGLRDGRGKRVMQILDHCSVYILIAGSYTPVLLCGIAREEPVTAWVLFGIVWGLAAVAIVLNSIDLRSFRHLSMALYLGMGWTIITRLPVLIRTIGKTGFLLILAGGILYTIGAALYNMGKKKPYMHSVFHLFVVAGSICHILAILLYVL
jgi:hemolysin III